MLCKISRSIHLDARRSLPVWLIQEVLFLTSGILAFFLRFDYNVTHTYYPHMAFALPVWALTKLFFSVVYRVDRRWWRSTSAMDLTAIAGVNFFGSVASAGIILAFGPSGFPRSLYAIDFIASFLLCASACLFARYSSEHAGRGAGRAGTRNALVYGAGAAGRALLRELRANARLGYTVLGFIDDDGNKHGMLVQGVRVLGGRAVLARAVEEYRIAEILIAVPSAGSEEMSRILDACEACEVPCKTIPSLTDVLHGQRLASQIRDVDVVDLLGRTPVELADDSISERICGQMVAVTGAAGSIGSELCRQIARFKPRAVLGIDVAETALFYLEQEMLQRFPEVTFIPAVGNVCNLERMMDVFETHRPAVVYHAAAYKHVPLMEQHIIEAVENNVIGTVHVAQAAMACGVQDFVLISTDKAVYPRSIMGVTKRVCELFVSSLTEGATRFIAVRFGNVLGSNGSVIPVFKKQISQGGPVTVTHPEMQRYFMTIPEAAQLVLQASSMRESSKIFLLDMGQPVKIVDLANRLIRLSGFRPAVDIQVKFTGMRPGEKLFEELNTEFENSLATWHRKIRILRATPANGDFMQDCIFDLRQAIRNRDEHELYRLLRTIVPEFQPREVRYVHQDESEHVLARSVGSV